MKRSEINQAIRNAIEILEENCLRLPEFAYWTPEEWRRHEGELDNLKKIMLGWDVTDFGSGDFHKIGAVLFTIRNGCLNDRSYGTPYAEKLIILRHDIQQALPMHFHGMKTEDIINRGGGTLVMTLYQSTEDGQLDKVYPVVVRMDGIEKTLQPGEIIEVAKGSSVTLTPGLYHSFWAKKDGGDLVVGEVSSVNDDRTDNIFLHPGDRYIAIEEDIAPEYYLCNEYDQFFCTD